MPRKKAPAQPVFALMYREITTSSLVRLVPADSLDEALEKSKKMMGWDFVNTETIKVEGPEKVLCGREVVYEKPKETSDQQERPAGLVERTARR